MPHLLLFLRPRENRTLQDFSEHHALRQSCIIHTRNKHHKKYPPLKQYNLDALATLFTRVSKQEIAWSVPLTFSPSDGAGQEGLLGSAKCVVTTRAWTPSDAPAQHRLEDVGFQHPDIQIMGSTRPIVQFEGILSEVVSGTVYVPVDGDSQVSVVDNVHPNVHENVFLFVPASTLNLAATPLSFASTLYQSWPPRQLEQKPCLQSRT